MSLKDLTVKFLVLFMLLKPVAAGGSSIFFDEMDKFDSLDLMDEDAMGCPWKKDTFEHQDSHDNQPEDEEWPGKKAILIVKPVYYQPHPRKSPAMAIHQQKKGPNLPIKHYASQPKDESSIWWKNLIYQMDNQKINEPIRPIKSVVIQQNQKEPIQQITTSAGEKSNQQENELDIQLNQAKYPGMISGQQEYSPSIKSHFTQSDQPQLMTTDQLEDVKTNSDIGFDKAATETIRSNWSSNQEALETTTPGPHLSNDDPLLKSFRWKSIKAKEHLARFIGFGQIEKSQALNGRLSARLSCQFGEPHIKSGSISDVSWAKFNANFKLDPENPSYDCRDQPAACGLMQIKTDTKTTVHPRPLRQNFSELAPVPSYSVTLHQVDEQDYGVYRCSAMRESLDEGGRRELVYRLLMLDK